MTQEASPQQISTIDENSPSSVFDEVEFTCSDADVKCAQLEIETEPEIDATSFPSTAKLVKPKSSVSKKLVYVLLERIAEYLFPLCQSARMPHWENVDSDVTSMVQQLYINRNCS